MSTAQTWLMIGALALIAYSTRITLIALLGKVTLSPLLQRALQLTVPAVFMAIVLPNLLLTSGMLDLALHNARIPAAAVAALAAWRTRSMLWTIVSGMLVFWIWRMIVP